MNKSFWCKIGFHKLTPWGPFVSTDGWWKGFQRLCMRPGCQHHDMKVTKRPGLVLQSRGSVISFRPPSETGPYLKDIPAAEEAWERIWKDLKG